MFEPNKYNGNIPGGRSANKEMSSGTGEPKRKNSRDSTKQKTGVSRKEKRTNKLVPRGPARVVKVAKG